MAEPCSSAVHRNQSAACVIQSAAFADFKLPKDGTTAAKDGTPAARCKNSRREGARRYGTNALSKKSQRKCFQVLLDALRVDSKELPRALQMIEDGISRETDS